MTVYDYDMSNIFRLIKCLARSTMTYGYDYVDYDYVYVYYYDMTSASSVQSVTR